MVLCKWCGDENVTPQNVYCAKMTDGKPEVWRLYTCDICGLEFQEEVMYEVSATDNTRLDNERGSD